MSVFKTIVSASLVLLFAGLGVGQEHQHHRQRENDRDRDRWMWQLPEQVMNAIGVEKGMIVADVGAGEGYFTLRLARRVDSAGKVFANDIDDRSLKNLEARCKDERLENVALLRGTPSDPQLPEKTMDLVLMVNVIHLVDDPVEFLQRIKPSLKPEGHLAIVQWDAAKMNAEVDLSSSDRDLYAKATVLKQIESADYEMERIETFLPMQNILVCKPAR